MDTNRSVLSILLRYINNREKRGNNHFIAKAVLENFDEISKMTIYELAEKCFVSPASISRFIRDLGYQSFSQFKEACLEEIDIDYDYSSKFNSYSIKEYPLFVQEYTENIRENLNFVSTSVDYKQFERINQYIFNAKKVGAFGLDFASMIAQHLQIKMAQMGKYIEVGVAQSEQLEIVERMEGDDVALIFSLEGGYFYYNEKILTLLKQKGITVIVFTLKKSPMIDRIANELILCGLNNDSTEGRLTILYLLELLIFQYKVQFYK